MQLFGRNIQLLIESTKKETKIFSSKNNFTIEFDIQFGTRASGLIKIWNVLPSTVEMCKPELYSNGKVKSYAKVELSAGYGDDLYLLTSASILSVEQKLEGVDKILEIKCGAKQDLLTSNYIIETYQNQTASSILRNIFLINKIVSYSINLDDDPIIPSISFNGNLKAALIDITRKAKAIYYEKYGKIYIESKEAKGKRESEIVFLGSLSGLIGTPEINGPKLKVRSLLNPKLNYGNIFFLQYKDQLNGGYVEGEYKVLNGKHYGGNKVQNYYTDLECIKS